MKKIILLLLLFISVLSCKKDFNEEIPKEQKEQLLNINIKTTGINITQLKSFDLNNWVYNYNLNKYDLIFTGLNHSYTFSKTIKELSDGFNIIVAPDTYTISYKSVTDKNVSNFCNIEINESKTINNSNDLTLEAKNSSFLIILDIQNINTMALSDGPNTYEMFSIDDFYYLYVSIEGANYSIRFKNASGAWTNFNLPLLTINNIYHIRNNVSGSSNINFEIYTYNSIII